MTPAQFKQIRERLGLTQGDLAIVLGVSGKKPISHYETGVRRPSPLIQALMSALNSLSEKKAKDLIELVTEHMAKIQRQLKGKKNARG